MGADRCVRVFVIDRCTRVRGGLDDHSERRLNKRTPAYTLLCLLTPIVSIAAPNYT